MKKIAIKKTNEFLYCETLDNGLQIYMYPKQDINNTFVSFNVKYGSINNEFIPLGEKSMRRFPNGIAHFLEHKMFEQENGIDPMMFYAQNGADVNAYTSLYNTSYHFSGSTHLNENLEYLLNFVQAPYFTDENVIKEQGIIEEEIKMYDDDPYSFLDEEIRMNTFQNHPARYPIAGTVEDIHTITKEDLYTCYKTFYHPTNMFLVISGNFDPANIVEVIKKNQSAKKFDKHNGITLKKVKEKAEVGESYEEKQMNVEVSKVTFGIKLSIAKMTMESKIRDLYLAIIFDSLFGSTSIFNEKMKEQGWLVSYVGINNTYADNYMLITINADTEYPENLINAIKDTLVKRNISEEDFKRKVKMLLSNNIAVYDNIDSINHLIVNDLITYGKYYTNFENIVNKLTKAELDKFNANLDFSNMSVLIVNPIVNKEKE